MPARPKGPQRPDRPSPAPEARQVRDLRRRLAATTQRLAEAEQTLEAIRTGAVDAVVVASGPGGEQVYTLQGAERSYRLLVETVNAGALTLALDGLVLYANQQAATLSGVPLEQLLGAALDRFVAPEDLAAFHAMSRAALAGEAAGDVTFLRAGRPVHVHLAFRRLDDAERPVLCVVATDLTERKQAEAALQRANAELEARVAERTAALESANADLQDANIQMEEANAELKQEVEERTQAEAALRESEERFRIAQELSPDGFTILRPVRDAHGRVVDFTWIYENAAIAGMNGTDPATVVGRRLLELFPGLAGSPFLETYQAVAETGQSRILEASYRGESIATLTWFRVAVVSMGTDIAILTQDITVGKEAEAQLRTALAQKEAALADNQALLREVHHRVKNNLQMLCDLMYLQMEAMPDRDKHQDLQDAYGRVYAIARLHEQLHQAMHSGHIQLADYLQRLVTGFGNLYPDVPVTIETASVDVLLDLDRAIHVGLIVNELLTNTVKHAFPKGQSGAVVVALGSAGDQISLRVRDNGRGLPADFDLEHARTLGLRMIHLLARRLEAQVTVAGNGGTTFTLTFPRHAEEPVEPK